MSKFVASLIVIAAVGLSAVATQAMPLGNNKTPDSLVVPVAGGCGAGFHPGPYGRCRANGWYGGRYWGAPGPCGGRGAHEVCGPYGRCRMVCN